MAQFKTAALVGIGRRHMICRKLVDVASPTKGQYKSTGHHLSVQHLYVIPYDVILCLVAMFTCNLAGIHTCVYSICIVILYIVIVYSLCIAILYIVIVVRGVCRHNNAIERNMLSDAIYELLCCCIM